MSHNSKNTRNLNRAKEITALHKNGGKGPARTTATHGKTNAWWQKGGTYAAFAKGAKKAKGTEA